jgi:hypothetical protein
MLACLLLQQTWVVDDNGGPGVSFTDTPPAVAAAADGDVVVVKPGQYSPFTVSGKGLRILGEDRLTTIVRSFTATVSTIADAPAGSPVVLECRSFGFPGLGLDLPQQLRILGSTTVAVVEQVTIDGEVFGPLASPPFGPGLLADGAEVHLRHRSISGPPGTLAGPGLPQDLPGKPALSVVNGGKVEVASSGLVGGSGAGQIAFGDVAGVGGPGISISSSPGTLSVLRVVGSAVHGGLGGTGACISPCLGTPVGAPGGPGILAASS